MWAKPAAMPVICESPATWTGVSDQKKVTLLPSWLSRLLPQAHTVPSDLSATPRSNPAAIATTPARPRICAGVERAGPGPLPSAPTTFAPHDHTVPSPLSAYEVP